MKNAIHRVLSTPLGGTVALMICFVLAALLFGLAVQMNTEMSPERVTMEMSQD